MASPLCSRIAISIILNIFLCGIVMGWGPISHYSFSCRAMGYTVFDDCLLNVTAHPLLQASAAPDAFGFTAPSFQVNLFEKNPVFYQFSCIPIPLVVVKKICHFLFEFFLFEFDNFFKVQCRVS